MMLSKLRLLIIATMCLTFCSCNSEPGLERLPVYSVTGQVMVDGQPAAGLQISSQNVAGVDAEHPTSSRALTDENGNFKFSTYEVGDGMPAGQYNLTFMWGQMRRGRYSGPDRLNDRYSDPASSKFPVKVENGPVDMGKIELTSK